MLVHFVLVRPLALLVFVAGALGDVVVIHMDAARGDLLVDLRLGGLVPHHLGEVACGGGKWGKESNFRFVEATKVRHYYETLLFFINCH